LLGGRSSGFLLLSLNIVGQRTSGLMVFGKGCQTQAKDEK
jgi:hypothetical protein